MTTSITGRSTIDDEPHDADRASTGRLGDRIFGGLATGSGLLVVAIVTLVGVFLLVQAVPSLMNNDANFLLSREWSPSGANPRFGIADLAWGTLVTSVIAMVIAVPLGVAVALFITQYAPRWLSRPAAATVDLLAAVPSIVYGFWGSTSPASTSSRSRTSSRARSAGSRSCPTRTSARRAPSPSPASSSRS